MFILTKSRALFVCAVYAVLLFLAPAPVQAGRPKEGDVLKIFSNQRVYVITNVDEGAPALADALLEGCAVKERRVLSLSEWNALPRETRWFVTCVYLVDRERLPSWSQVPLTCRAEPTEVWQEVVRTGRDWGIAYDVTVSAPDRAHLERAIGSFRRLKEAPRKIVTESVRSLAVVPVGEGATQAVTGSPLRGDRYPHMVPLRDYQSRQTRMTAMDEIVLVDRGSAIVNTLPTAFAAVSDKLLAANADVVAWRESKPGGYVRAYVSAPTGAMLASIVAKSPDNLLALAAFGTPTVLASARDLRPVRRVAVASVAGQSMDDVTAQSVAALAATELRNLNAFEVLERAALTTVLAEIALDQAGLTRGTNRAKVRQLAAADALLIVDLSRSTGGTQYTSQAVRATAPMEPAPRRPSEPSRLKNDFNVGGRNGDLLKAVVVGLLKNKVGTKTDDEYETDLREYRRTALPAWERSVRDHQARADTRQIAWRQTIAARSTVHIAGSVRLVDLTDGLVLWEAPIASTDVAEKTTQTRTAYTTGEMSAAPGADDLPGANGEIPGELLTRTAEKAVGDLLRALPASALLPSTTAPPISADTDTAQTGKIIDVDGDTVLIGLGTNDGLRVGDTLVGTGASVGLRLQVTRVRPRTCDAVF
ncbi:MAG: hypothetical protein H7Y38_08925, partial [Armatimonadetes bacterium]|nr:hypothetical protein [Armatimonadota bacterium]